MNLRRIALGLAALAVIALSCATAQAGHGSRGSFGGMFSRGGHGSHGGHGSFGGMFSRGGNGWPRQLRRFVLAQPRQLRGQL